MLRLEATHCSSITDAPTDHSSSLSLASFFTTYLLKNEGPQGRFASAASACELPRRFGVPTVAGAVCFLARACEGLRGRFESAATSSGVSASSSSSFAAAAASAGSAAASAASAGSAAAAAASAGSAAQLLPPPASGDAWMLQFLQLPSEAWEPWS